MNEEKLFLYLERQPQNVLIDLLRRCYRELNTEKIRDIFHQFETKYLLAFPVNGKELLNNISKFYYDSLECKYYQEPKKPHDFHIIPEQTNVWFENMATYFNESSKLTEQGEHSIAFKCFKMLFDLIHHMETTEIVFAPECGIWMLPISLEQCTKFYIYSASTLLNPDEYAVFIFSFINLSRKIRKNDPICIQALEVANQNQRETLVRYIDCQNTEFNKRSLLET